MAAFAGISATACDLAYLSAQHDTDASNDAAVADAGIVDAADAPDGRCAGVFDETWSTPDGPGWSGAWTTVPKDGISYGVAGGRGTITWSGVDTGTGIALVKGVSAKTIDVRASVRASSNGPRIMVLARADATGDNAYAAVVRFDTETIAMGHLVWGDDSAIADLGAGPKIGDVALVHFRVEAKGSRATLSLSVWTQGTTEPAGFQFTAVDEARGDSPGTAGIRADLSENRTVEIDDVHVTYDCP